MNHTVYASIDAAGMVSCTDKFQSYIAELESIAPKAFSDYRMKRMQLSSIKNAAGVSNLIYSVEMMRK